jgi:Tfp pilus assembly protein PilV
MDFKFKKDGFTIIEAIVAIFILTTGILGAFSFISHFTEYSSISTMRLTASYLAQEGVEIIKNIRDSNFIDGNYSVDWNEGFATSSDWEGEADYTNDNSLDSYSNTYLNIDVNGFYSYGAGSQSLFKRKITIGTSTASSTYITVEVSWSEKGRNHNVAVEEEIYSWPWQ